MFSEELEKYSWEETTREIYSKTAADVELALSKSQLAIDDFMALISPAAEKYLEPMAALSQKYTLQRFGKTISMYIPLYITNSCTNFCVYCGFNHNNPLKRVILIEDDPFEGIVVIESAITTIPSNGSSSMRKRFSMNCMLSKNWEILKIY